MVSRLFELDDVQYGTAFSAIQINRFQLTNQRMFSVQDICRLHG